jgi:hypothetical protein
VAKGILIKCTRITINSIEIKSKGELVFISAYSGIGKTTSDYVGCLNAADEQKQNRNQESEEAHSL